MATLVSGAVAVTVGLGIRLWGGTDANTDVLAWLLGAAALAWVAAIAVFARIREPAGADGADAAGESWLARSWRLLAGDAPFRKFVVVRALLLVSALSPPFIVALAAEQGSGGLSGLGPFVIASGLAGIVGGRPFGRLADISSRKLMIAGAAAASAIIGALLGIERIEALRDAPWVFFVAYFLLTVTHTGVRVARKTYVVDMATGDQRTEYVAVSNTAMGVLLLITGAASSALAQLGPEAALLFLAGLGLLGVLVGRSLEEVSTGAA
jgi:MFS family permease